MHHASPHQTRYIRAFVALYAGLGSLWVLVAVRWFALDSSQPAWLRLQTGSALGLVAIASGLLYGLLHWRERQLGQRQTASLPRDDSRQPLFTDHPQPCWIHDPATLNILAANPAASDRYGYSVSEFTDLNWRDLAAPDTLAALETASDQLTSDRRPHAQPGEIRDCQGQLHAVELAIAPVAYDGRPAHLTLLRETDPCEQLEAQLHRYAFYDPLTQLPNKTWFLAHLDEHLQAARAGTTSFFTVMFLELDRFQAVKYSLSHRFAEAMLAATAERLQTCLNLAEPVARAGDCSLAFLLDNLYTALDAEAIADYIDQQLSQPLDVDGQEVLSPVSIGIAIVDTPELTEQRPEEILQAADMAMHHARQQLKTAHAIFEPAMLELALGRFQLESDLRQAIAREEFAVFYQPIVELATGQLAGFEALIRWQQSDGRWVEPDSFLPSAEETGLIGLIDWWVLGVACKQLGEWQQQLPPDRSLSLSINASGALLSQLGFLSRLRQLLASNGIRRGSLVLEVTERTALDQHLAATGMVEAIAALGVRLAIDDFGTGDSCLERLSQLPIEILKIDRSFIARMLSEQNSLEIIQAILTLARGLGMVTVAEGTETATQISQLQNLGCEFSQGYYFAQPLNSSAARELFVQQWQW